MIPTLQAFARRYGFKSTDHDVFKIQFLMVLAMSVVLGISFDAQLEWRRYATEHHLELMMRGWDVVAWLTLLCAAPGMLFLIRRFPLTLGRIRRNLAGLVVGSSLILSGDGQNQPLRVTSKPATLSEINLRRERLESQNDADESTQGGPTRNNNQTGSSLLSVGNG